MESISPINRLMQISTEAIYNSQHKVDTGGQEKRVVAGKDNGLAENQSVHVQKLVETLVDTKNQLSKEIAANRIAYLDPNIVGELEAAIQLAIAHPLDAKVNEIYLVTFGYNSPLWHVLREMQKLLQTVEFLKDPRGKKVAKVDKKNRERRKKEKEEGQDAAPNH